MKKIAFLLLAGLTIGIYYFWEAEKLHIPTMFHCSTNKDFPHKEIDIPLQVPIIKSINRMEANPSYIPHKYLNNNALSCSNCHQNLNYKELSSDSCLTCHDGTMGFYNVSKETGGSPFHIKPKFDWQKQQEGEIDKRDRALTCSNCHNPHGSYSDRLLNNNPFGTANLIPENGGYLAKGKVYDFSELVKTNNVFKGSLIGGSNSGVWFSRKDGEVEDTKIPTFMFVRGSGQQLGLVKEGIPGSATAIIVYQYMERQDAHLLPYRRGYYIPEKLPWLYGYDYGAHGKIYWTRFFIGDPAPENLAKGTADNEKILYQDIVGTNVVQGNKNVIFNYRKGLVYATDSTLDSVTSGEVAQSHSISLEKIETTKNTGVTIFKTNFEALSQFDIDQESIWTSKESRLGRLAVDATKFCSSCHLAYLTGLTPRKFGFAHQNFSDFYKWNCLKCHYGHNPSKEDNH